MASKFIFIGILLCGFIFGTFAHSYVTSPTSRSNQKQSQSGCRGPSCLGPCDSTTPSNPISVTRGQTITIEWPRNNHAGGFIRFAWALTSQSNSHAAFDNHVQQINCHEVGGCGPNSASDPNGADSGPADGSSRACKSTLVVPGDLTDGTWTLQWSWFGGAFALGDYYSCVDYKVTGGPVSTLVPKFVGGDYTYPGQQKCKFFNTDRLHQCVQEPCDRPIFTLYQERSGAPVDAGLTKSSSASSTSTSTTGRASTSTSTTGRASTSTSTTGRASTSTSTTGRASTSTSTTGRATPSTGSSSGSSGSSTNCAAATKVLSSKASISVDAWNNIYRLMITVENTNPSADWYVELTYPESSTIIQTVLDGGSLECQGGSRAVIKPKSWALTASSVTFEVQALNSMNFSIDKIRSVVSARVVSK